MLDQEYVDDWLSQFLRRLRERFGDRLAFVGHHGSWARGEPRVGSDIDVLVILDRIEDADLEAYREIVYSMPDAQSVASTALVSVGELRACLRYEQTGCYYGCKVLYGTLDGLVAKPKPTDSDFIADVRMKASANLHHARHYMLHPHDPAVVVNRLYYPFKECFYALQSWMLLTTGTYYARKTDMLAALSAADDREVVRIAKDWHQLSQDRTDRPGHYVRVLERWSRKTLAKVADWAGGS